MFQLTGIALQGRDCHAWFSFFPEEFPFYQVVLQNKGNGQ